ncbi:MAG: hypothetical protein ACWIPI_05795, partial [Polaribacter sp.]
MKNKTAVLIFANSAEKDANLKSFFSTDVFSEFKKKIVQKTDLPFNSKEDLQLIINSFKTISTSVLTILKFIIYKSKTVFIVPFFGIKK